mmetsp:Transcript_85751/g.135429  ORF Transcript_85751/g.135429 Transcript_85751/m.135429 type:complete len:517 (+) Transcript_85751:114-1664(+)
MRVQQPGACQLLGNLLDDISLSCDSGTEASRASRLREMTVDHVTKRNIELLYLEAKLNAEDDLREKARHRLATEQNHRRLPPSAREKGQPPRSNCLDGDVLVSRSCKDTLESCEVILNLLDNMSACCDHAFEKPVVKVRGMKRDAASSIAAFVARISKQETAMREAKQKLAQSREETSREAMRFGQRYDYTKSDLNSTSTPSTYVPDGTFDSALLTFDTPFATGGDTELELGKEPKLKGVLAAIPQDTWSPPTMPTNFDERLRAVKAEEEKTENRKDRIILNESSSLPNLRVPSLLADDGKNLKDSSRHGLAIADTRLWSIDWLAIADTRRNSVPERRKRAQSLLLPKTPFLRKVEVAPRKRATDIDFHAVVAQAPYKSLHSAVARQEEETKAMQELQEQQSQSHSKWTNEEPDKSKLHPELVAAGRGSPRNIQNVHDEIPRYPGIQGVQYSSLPHHRRMRKCVRYGMRYECDSPYCEGCNPLANTGVHHPPIITGFEGGLRQPILITGCEGVDDV